MPNQQWKWEWFEGILLLDLFLKRAGRGVSRDTPEIQEVSLLLNSPVLRPPSAPSTYRNLNGIARQYGGFQHLDDSSRLGQKTSRLFEDLWRTYKERPDEVAELARQIREVTVESAAYEQGQQALLRIRPSEVTPLPSTSEWDLEIGEELTRDQRRRRFGGSIYGGIEPSARTPNIFIYTDPSVGETHGYNYDGWVEEDTIFQYTGAGRVGDQLMRSGNQAILDHELAGRALRVFAANGIVAGTAKTKRQLYIGEFRLDSHLSHFVADAPDDNGDPRSVFVFRLRPVDEAFVRADERCPNRAPPTSTRVEEAEVETWTEESEVEGSYVTSFERKPIESVTSLRREAELVGRYKKHLESQGHEIKSRKIYLTGAVQPLRVDLFDTTTGDLCEAKGSTTRVQVRYAVGQVLDYSRHVEHKTLSVLLPTRPADDLVALLTGLGIACVYETRRNLFKRIES